MAQKIVFASGKGGVGKSSVALGLARTLAARNIKVLLVDFDIGLRSLDMMLGVSEQVAFDWGDALLGNAEPENCMIRMDSLALMAAPMDYDDAFEPEAVRSLFCGIEADFDFILFDAPAGLGRGFELACSAADAAVLVTTPDSVCVRSCAAAARRLRQTECNHLALIINRFEEKPVIKKNLLNIDDCIDAVAVRLGGVIPEDAAVVQSSVTGKQPDKKAPSSRAYDRIGRRLLGEKVKLFED